MKLFNGLLSILEEQTRCYEKAYQLKEQEQQMVITGQHEALQKNVKEIDDISQTIRSLEKARQEIVESIAQQYELSADTLDLRRVIELADEESGGALESIAERLVAVIQRTSRINEDNAYLIRRSLDLVNQSLEVLTGFSVDRETYGHDGLPQHRDATTVAVDRQA